MSADAGTNMEDECSTEPYNCLQEDARKQESLESPIARPRIARETENMPVTDLFFYSPIPPLLIQQAHKFKSYGGGRSK